MATQLFCSLFLRLLCLAPSRVPGTLCVAVHFRLSNLEHFLVRVHRLRRIQSGGRSEGLTPGFDLTVRSTPEVDYLRFSSYSALGTRLFRTAKNYLGRGPQSLQLGNSIWLFPTLMTPMVLKRAATGNYRLFRGSCVHGVVYGEALRGLTGTLEEIELE